MANNIWYKFKSEVQWKGLKFDGLDITVAEIKQLVLKSPADCQLVLSNACTGEVYRNNRERVPKNTSVLVTRLPAERRKRKRAESADVKREGGRDFLRDLHSMSEEQRLEAVIKQARQFK